MQIAITAAGFLPEKADRLRRAMATFKRSGRIREFERDFINGMLGNSYTEEFAKQCFSQIQGFAEYGFPESHAASFALLVYASSWIKTYYPDVFCAALLNSQPMGFYAPAQLIRDAREHGVTVLPVDINRSQWDCTLEEVDCGHPLDRRHESMREVIKTRYGLRIGFRQVKGLNQKEMVEKLVANRGGGYRSVHDLWSRSRLDRSSLERLADADGFGSIGLGRRQALWAVRGLETKSASERAPLFEIAGATDLRPEPALQLPLMLPGEEVIEDYRHLSLSLKAHPVSFLREEFRSMGITRSVDLLTIRNGQRVTIGGVVLVRQRPGSAKGVIFMTLEDETGVANAIVWPKMFEKYRPVVMGARLVKIRGRLQSQNGVIHTVVEHIEDMTPMLGLLQREARRFGSPRSDEALKSGGGSWRPKPHPRIQQQAAAEEAAPVPGNVNGGDPGHVMPKGRNFH
jgi:DNA polymerase-3 subunit alpha/error-prone DNA polymerase